jgi:signal transduction histidine kinase
VQQGSVNDVPPRGVSAASGLPGSTLGEGQGDRYVDLNKRLSTVNSSGAGVITLLMIVSLWGQWRPLAVVGAIQAAVIAFNVWVNLVHLPRRGRSAEILRAVVNLATSVVTNHVAGWPPAVWLWLPFVALAFDHLGRGVATWMLLGLCVVQDAAALADGVPWIYPLTFTAFAVFCSQLSRFRYGFIRDMLLESDEQRAELERAHVELHEAHEQLTEAARAREVAERELRQSQKLEAVGRLAAGVAHEINTPVQFVGDSVQFLRDATLDLVGTIERLQGVRRAVLDGRAASEVARETLDHEATVDLPYLLENMPKSFERALEGTRRVAAIVRSMKSFAHPGSLEMQPVDLNQAIESTLIIARSEYKHVAELRTDFGDLPRVTCHAGDVNQAVLNIVVNAAHAIGAAVQGSERLGSIEVRTWRDGDDAMVSIGDTGGGIPEAIRDRIFEPFFTTKQVGVGTGQGLAIAHSVIVTKHGGELRFETEPGRGTTFFIRLPIDGGARAATGAVATAAE